MGGRRKYCSAQPYLDYIGVSEKDRKEEKSMNKKRIRMVADIIVDEEKTDYKGEELLKVIKESIEETFAMEPGSWELKDIRFVEEKK